MTPSTPDTYATDSEVCTTTRRARARVKAENMERHMEKVHPRTVG